MLFLDEEFYIQWELLNVHVKENGLVCEFNQGQPSY